MTTAQAIDSLELLALFMQEVPIEKTRRGDVTRQMRDVAFDLIDFIAEGPVKDGTEDMWLRTLQHHAMTLRASDEASKFILDAFMEIIRTFHDEMSSEQQERIKELGFEL